MTRKSGKRPVLLSDGLLERDDAAGALLRLGNPGAFQHGNHMRPVLLAKLAHAVAVLQVIFAVGQLQAALQQVCGVMIRIIEVRSGPQTQEVWAVIVGVIERVLVGPKALTKRAGQFALVVNVMNRGENRLQGLQAECFNGSLIHVGLIKVGNSLLPWRRSTGLYQIFNQSGRAMVAEFGKPRKDTDR